MKDLNSVLIEGLIQAVKPKKDKSGHWVEIRSRKGKDTDDDCASHRFRIAVSSRLRNCTPELLALGRRIRVVGKLDRESRLGAYVEAEVVEFKAGVTV